jgi:hypothetical protein
MKLLSACALGAALMLGSFPVSGATVIGFGVFENKSADKDFDYLSKILPNSFAVSVESNFDISAIKPSEVESLLQEKDFEFKGEYSDLELVNLTRELPVNYFVYGGYRPLPDNNIEIRVNIYNKDTCELFSFTNSGRMETEIFNLVDRLTGIFDDLFKSDFIFKTTDIPKRSRLAFITNLEPAELNEFYLEFMKQGYKISSVQGNELASHIRADDFDRLRHVALKEKSFQRIRDAKPLVFSLSQWNGASYISAQKELRDSITRYVYHYAQEQEKVLLSLSRQYKFDIDYLCIVGFDENRGKAWIRTFDLTRYDSSLIWLQAGITPAESSAGPGGIAAAIMNLFPKKDKK